jgi:hypothetical protein
LPDTAVNSQVLANLLSGRENIFSKQEWDAAARAAQHEGVAPLAYWILSTSGKISALPQSARDALRASYSRSWKHNQDIFNELEILARAFDRAGIPVVVLKGACFALTIYPDIGTRPMGDLDLLVPAGKLDEAVEIAKAFGYEDYKPEASPGLRDLLDHEICMRKNGTQIITEIHRSLIADKTFKYAVPVNWFWMQTQAFDQARFPNLLVLTPAAQLLYASAHAMLQHGGKSAPLRWFVDIDRIIRVYEGRMDWELVLSQARVFEWGSALDAALELAREYFDTPIPQGVLDELSKHSDRHRALVEELKRQPLTHTQGELQMLQTLNTHGKIRLFLALVFPSPAYMRRRYKLKTPWALPPYYLLRWGGILADGVRTLIILIKNSLPHTKS